MIKYRIKTEIWGTNKVFVIEKSYPPFLFFDRGWIYKGYAFCLEEAKIKLEKIKKLENFKSEVLHEE